MKYLKKINSKWEDKFEFILKGNRPVHFNGHVDLINFKLSIPNEFKIINYEKSSYYLYKGEVFKIESMGNQIEMKIVDGYVLIEDLKDSISKYENRIIEMEDAIQKIKHGGDE